MNSLSVLGGCWMFRWSGLQKVDSLCRTLGQVRVSNVLWLNIETGAGAGLVPSVLVLRRFN